MTAARSCRAATPVAPDAPAAPADAGAKPATRKTGLKTGSKLSTNKRAPAPERRTARRETAVLDALSEGASLKAAAVAAGVRPVTLATWQASDASFAAAIAIATEAGADALEDEALRRAVDGVNEPVFYRGERIGTARKYSGTLLMFLLKSRRPEIYGTVAQKKASQDSAEDAAAHDAADDLGATVRDLSPTERRQRLTAILRGGEG